MVRTCSDQQTVTEAFLPSCRNQRTLWERSQIESSLIIWWTENNRGFPSKLLKPDDSWYNFGKLVTVVQNRKLVTWPDYVLWSSDEPKMTEAFLPSCWNQMIGDITLARLWEWPSDQTCRLDQNILFDHLIITTEQHRIEKVLFSPNWEPKSIQTFTFVRRQLVNANRKQMCCKCTSLMGMHIETDEH